MHQSEIENLKWAEGKQVIKTEAIPCIDKGVSPVQV